MAEPYCFVVVVDCFLRGRAELYTAMNGMLRLNGPVLGNDQIDVRKFEMIVAFQPFEVTDQRGRSFEVGAVYVHDGCKYMPP